MNSHFIYFFEEIEVDTLSSFIISLGGFKHHTYKDYWLFDRSRVKGKWVSSGLVHVSYSRNVPMSDIYAEGVKEKYGIAVKPEDVRIVDVFSSNRQYEFQRELCEQIGRFVKGIVYMELTGNPEMNFHGCANIDSETETVDTIPGSIVDR